MHRPLLPALLLALSPAFAALAQMPATAAAPTPAPSATSRTPIASPTPARFALSATSATPAAAAASTVRLSGDPTRVLVLGTVHLGQEGGGDVTPEAIEPVLLRLAAYAPEIITIESMPGETCDLMARHPEVYDPEGGAQYCPDTAAARSATGLDVPAAIASMERQLADWPDAPTPAQRRRLAATFLAAGDPNSALVQWLHLGEQERRPGDGLDEVLVAALRKRADSDNENTVIAVALAVRLGLQRVHPVDDHTGDNLRIDDMDGFATAIRSAWDSAPPECGALRARDKALREAPDLLPLYRHTNSADYQRMPMACDFALALAEPSPQRFGRQYVGGWDLRNLRMVANIGTTFRERPGARVLSIVGASHKAWFDRLLGQLQGVDMVDAAEILGEE
ncbi:DUF5694 domain-containing protein [Luteimonas kalidii]|uniref:DUF5694 domain-containing protein n=1 Tax=Luteimonas kalidii TaxID=3042025 RepID=A0ABT6JS62_9GAMM|nr:DUF5694 domain-containing protein [Luteimonas kalidii]MDH5833308.1 DUF5694 domain-containing protein [Luteimonas kalidii]